MDDSKQSYGLREWITRFREHSWTLDDVLGTKTCIYIVLPLLVPAFLGTVLIDSENALGKVVVQLAFEFFFVPIFITSLWLSAHCLPKVPSIAIWLGRAILALFCAAIFSYLANGYFVLWNALTGQHEEILVSGKVVKMESHSGRYAGNQSNITIQYGGRDIELTVTSATYSVLKIGDVYEQKMKLGGLGYYYNWGLAVWK
jgi:hypothetical protein